MRSKNKALSVVLSAILVVTLIVAVANHLNSKDSFKKNGEFYNEDDDYQVLFYGSSHAVMAISPMELWNGYGITSYNMANYGQWMTEDYWLLKDHIKRHKPELVVMDVYGVCLDDKFNEVLLPATHSMFDAVPIGIHKLLAVEDIFESNKDDKMEFMLPFSYYHSRWNEIDKSFWDRPIYGVEKGADLDSITYSESALVWDNDGQNFIGESTKNDSETVGKEYLRKSIELCQQNNINVLLVAIPFDASTDEQEYINSVQDIANEYGVNFWNMIQEDDIIDYNVDMHDSTHVNSAGARKITNRLGDYIIENYGISDLRGILEIAEKWDKNYLDYTKYKHNWLRSQSELKPYLMLLSNDNYVMNISINSDVITLECKEEQYCLDKLLDVVGKYQASEVIIEVTESSYGDVVDRVRCNIETGILERDDGI